MVGFGKKLGEFDNRNPCSKIDVIAPVSNLSLIIVIDNRCAGLFEVRDGRVPLSTHYRDFLARNSGHQKNTYPRSRLVI